MIHQFQRISSFMRYSTMNWISVERRHLPALIVTGIVVALNGLLVPLAVLRPSTSTAADALGELEPLALVVDHDIASGPGCGGLAVINVDEGIVEFRDATRAPTVFDLDVNINQGQVLGSPGRGNSARYVRWMRTDESWRNWRRQTIVETAEFPAVGTLSGLAFSSDGENLFLGIRLAGSGMSVGAFQVSDLDVEGDEIEPPTPIMMGAADGHVPAKVITTRDGSLVHVISSVGSINSLETSLLSPAAKPVRHAPFVPDPVLAGALASNEFTTTPRIVFADISPDERYLVTNRWAEPELSVVDLHARRSWTLPAGEGITMTGGVAFNHAWRNPGLLAVNVLDAVVVYRFDPDGPLEELARHPINPVHQTVGGPAYPVPGNVSWSSRGDHLIVTTNHGDKDFTIIEVAGCGTSLRQVAELAVCSSDLNRGRAIWTANKRMTPPADFGSRCPAPELRPTATPPPIPSPTATPVATPVSKNLRESRAEERVIVIEGSSTVDIARCGGITHFAIWEGRPRSGARGKAEPGSWAATSGGAVFVVGSGSGEAETYDVYEPRLNASSLETKWRTGAVTMSVGASMPYGATSFVWGDTQILLTYRDHESGEVALGLFDRFGIASGTVSPPLAMASFERGVPAALVLEGYSGHGALMCCGGTAWVVTDLGEVWQLTIADDMASMTLSGPIAELGEIPPVPGESGPASRRIHAVLSPNERFLLVSGWGNGDIRVVNLAEGTVESTEFDDRITMIGQLATNHGWENPGRVAVHAGTHLMVLAIDPRNGTLTEIGRHPIAPPRNEEGFVEPGHIAWSTNGLALVATIDNDTNEFMTLWVRECGRLIEPLYEVAICPEKGVPNRGRGIFTLNATYPTPAGYDPRCPAGVIPATPTPSSTPSHGSAVYLPAAMRR